MIHLTVFGEFSSIPILGKTSPPPPCTMLTRHEMTIVPERVINIDSKILQSVSRVLQPIVALKNDRAL